jgi:hypothetical protein
MIKLLNLGDKQMKTILLALLLTASFASQATEVMSVGFLKEGLSLKGEPRANVEGIITGMDMALHLNNQVCHHPQPTSGEITANVTNFLFSTKDFDNYNADSALVKIMMTLYPCRVQR